MFVLFHASFCDFKAQVEEYYISLSVRPLRMDALFEEYNLFEIQNKHFIFQGGIDKSGNSGFGILRNFNTIYINGLNIHFLQYHISILYCTHSCKPLLPLVLVLRYQVTDAVLPGLRFTVLLLPKRYLASPSFSNCH